jgi:DNA-binding MarR family transcriptional regulator
VTEPSAPDTERLDNRLFFRLFQLGNVLQRQAVAQLGISAVQWAVLGALSQARFADGIPLSALGEYLAVSRQNLDGVLKRLERDGLVARVADEGDRRARLVRITAAGRTFWDRLGGDIARFYDDATSAIPVAEREATLRTLRALQLGIERVSLPGRGGRRR